jgi:hypothetical protein
MLTGAINSLVWILILIVIIAVVIAVLRTVTRPRGSTTVVEQQPVARQAPPAPSGGLAPGWYPDQNDPSLMRYYDGRVWTAQTQPHA